MQGRFLGKKDVKRILEQLNIQWGFSEPLDYLFFQNNKHRIFLVNKEFALLDFSKLRINSVGMYFGEIMKNSEVRLCIEGSQFVGKFAKKNVICVDEDNARKWLYGMDIKIIEYNKEVDVNKFVILQFGDYFIGCGRYKEGIVSNHVGKNRRIGTLD